MHAGWTAESPGHVGVLLAGSLTLRVVRSYRAYRLASGAGCSLRVWPAAAGFTRITPSGVSSRNTAAVYADQG